MENKLAEFLGHRKIQRLPDTITLGGVTLGKSSYLALGDVMQDFFACEEWTIPQALLQGRRLIWKVMMAVHAQQDVSPEGIRDMAASLSEMERRHVPEAVPQTLTGRAISAIDLLPFVIFDIVQEECLKNKNGSVGLSILFIRVVLDLINNKGSYEVWNLERPVDMAEAAKIELNEHEPAFQKELRHYYRQLFANRRLFLRDSDFLKTYFQLGASYAQILKVARWMAYAEGETVVGARHILDAASYVDIRVSSVKTMADTPIEKLTNIINDILSAREDSFLRVMLAESY